jgi:proteasome activator subunit 4
MKLLSLLADKTFSERGYSGTGRLIQRVLNTLVGVYPLNARFVNTDVWNSEGMYFRLDVYLQLADGSNSGFDKDHNSVWGKLHRVEDVKIEWHGGLRSPPSNRSKGLILLQSHRMRRSPLYSRF